MTVVQKLVGEIRNETSRDPAKHDAASVVDLYFLLHRAAALLELVDEERRELMVHRQGACAPEAK